MEKEKKEEEAKLIDRLTQQVIGPFHHCLLSACVNLWSAACSGLQSAFYVQNDINKESWIVSIHSIN